MKLLIAAFLFLGATSSAYSSDPLPIAVQSWLQANSTSDDEERDAMIDEVVSANFVSSTMDGAAVGDRDSFKRFLRGAHAAFDNYQISMLDSVIDDRRVWLRLRGTGTHVGPIMGIEPSGINVSIGVVVVLEVADGRIIHEWQLSDIPKLTQQLTNNAGQASGNTKSKP